MSISLEDSLYSKIDSCTQSNCDIFVCEHIHLEWEIDFDDKTISGSARHGVKTIKEGCNLMHFDTSNLDIFSVSIGNKPAEFILQEKSALFGSQLSVTIPDEFCNLGSSFDVLIDYCTSSEASAIQWLDKEATKGGKHPYVFTQCQAIHARSLLPCQDTPGVKSTYTANVTVSESWCTILMSALSVESPDPEVFSFRQPIPIPAYLIALAGGNLESREISSRVRIWAEPEVVQEAAVEFSETEDFLLTAESLTCPYEWTRYDVLCLPPSFPYGGMENPCLTFATPTLLAGDKSLADVIAHEIAHSWTGNLVTNHTWDHFWLNEGWTVWLERKITSRIKTDINILKLSAHSGWKHLKDDISQQGGDEGQFTSLVWPLRGQDPDDAFSSVPYEKGFNLLYYLENIVGTTLFESFAKAYLQQFKTITVTTGEFRDFFVHYMKSASPEAATKTASIDWSSLFHNKGMPAHTPNFNNPLLASVQSLSERWISFFASKKLIPANDNFSSSDIQAWSSLQKIIFLELLIEFAEKRLFTTSFLEILDKYYSFTECNNAEIKFRWQSLCLKCNANWIIPHVVKFITSQGRMKFVRPLYRSLIATEAGRKIANETFDSNSLMYHPICRKMVASDLKKKEQAKTTGISIEDLFSAKHSTLYISLAAIATIGAICFVRYYRSK